MFENLINFLISVLPLTIIFYFSPCILAPNYWVFTLNFFLINMLFWWTPIPRAILIIKAIKNKNLFLDEEQKLALKLSKKEEEEIAEMIKNKPNLSKE